jgi:hypothetical protein
MTTGLLLRARPSGVVATLRSWTEAWYPPRRFRVAQAAPTIYIVRPFNPETLTPFHPIVGICLDFLPPKSYLAFDSAQQCRSGDLCLIKIEGENRGVIKQLFERRGKWFLRSSHVQMNLEPHQPLGPVAVVLAGLGRWSPELAAQHAHEARAYREFLAEAPMSVRGGLITSLIGTGPVYPGNS